MWKEYTRIARRLKTGVEPIWFEIMPCASFYSVLRNTPEVSRMVSATFNNLLRKVNDEQWLMYKYINTYPFYENKKEFFLLRNEEREWLRCSGYSVCVCVPT